MNAVDELLTRGVTNILPTKKGLADLISQRKIKLYQGFDPTGKLHLGHAIGLRKLMQFANLGNEVIFLFGTGTVLVGDPTQRAMKRDKITNKEIENHINAWRSQTASIVDFNKVKILKNGYWLNNLTVKDFINISSNISAIQLFKREMFQSRLAKGETVWFHEMMYPLLQGYDSVVMDVDLEIGGTDQEFNMLIGRELQKKLNKKEKYVMTLKMIVGTDGKQMSKSSGNCIWLDDKAYDMFGKLMSIPDEQIEPYLETLTELPLEIMTKEGPLTVKKKLAYDIVSQIHGEKNAKEAKSKFEKTFQQKKPIYETKIQFEKNLAQTITPYTSLASISDAKRYISQGAVDVNGKTITDPTYQPKVGDKIKIGTTTFGTVKN